MTEAAILEMCRPQRQPCEQWSRTMGYYRPVSQYNKGKQSEFNERVCFVESKACPCEMKKAV